MLYLDDWPVEQRRNIIGVFTDIDDTLTTDGAITPDALQALTQLKAAGLQRLRATVAALAPEFAARSEDLRDWKQTSLLSVVSGCLPRWSRPGLLLIGDAAHPASPVGGVGINLAVQDALEAAKRLMGPLELGTLEESDLIAVERARRGPTRLVQACQDFAQRWVVARALGPRAENAGPIRLPWWLRTALSFPKMRQIPGGLIAFAARPKSQAPRLDHLETALESHVSAVQVQAKS